MSKVKAFLKQNKKGNETIDFSLPNFGAPLTIRIISGKEFEAIQERCFINKPGKKGRQERHFDGTKCNRELCIASLVVPDLNDTELQESYGVVGASDLFGEMFNWGEQSIILEKVTEASGIDEDINTKIEEAKN